MGEVEQAISGPPKTLSAVAVVFSMLGLGVLGAIMMRLAGWLAWKMLRGSAMVGSATP